MGKKKIFELRRSWNIRPKPLKKNNPYHPSNIKIYKNIPTKNIPDTESLSDTYDRVISYYKRNIEIKIIKKKNVLISAHGNSLRALCKYLFKLDEKKISLLEIPTGNPLFININSNKISECKYLDRNRAKDLLIF